MTVSVIIPSYNHAKYLRRRIDSVLNQTFRDFEIIILDDFSTDGSRDIINEYAQAYPHIRVIFNNENSGSPFAQWNLGVSHANGEYIWIAESDDYADVRFLEKSIAILSSKKDIGFIFCDSVILDEEKNKTYLLSDRRNGRFLRKNRNISELFYFENPVACSSSVLFRKVVYISSGLAETSMKYCGDWLLFVKMKGLSSVEYIPEPLNVFRLHANSSYHSYFKNWVYAKEIWKIYSYVLKNYNVSFLHFFRISKKLILTFLLRLTYLCRICQCLKIELPRSAKRRITPEYYIIT